MEAKAFNQVLKANAKISVYEMRGVLGETSDDCGGVSPLNEKCNSAYTNYNPYKNGYSEAHINGQNIVGGYFHLTIFGYKSEEDARKANIKVTYTPAYGGNVALELFKNGYQGIFQGMGKYLFDKKIYGVYDERYGNNDSLWWVKQKINNGIYKFEDLNNKYIKPTYLHLINP
ncbi:hypothetical protein EWV09_06130 [Campylobacter lari]|nr:hypothetical protein [Campylobacter lari]